ncbi:MAG: EAL and HDOD domain-containing protein [Acidobacteriota bacterium]
MDVFVARQPIFTRLQKVFGYELLFRSSMDNFCSRDIERNLAAANVIVGALVNFGLDTLSGGKRVFVNLTHDLLVSGAAALLPREQTVIEVLEGIAPDQAVIDACRGLRKQGYLLALDDFVEIEGNQPLVEIADFIKVDFLATTPRQRRELGRALAAQGKKMLAEKVETPEQAAEALDSGYSYLQGYFFARPAIARGRAIPGSRLRHLEMTKILREPELDFRAVEQIVKCDLSLSYKLLRFVNSAAHAWTDQIDSIRHALVLLGEDDVRRLLSLIALSGLVQDKPPELALASVVRARFAESLAGQGSLSHRQLDLFLLGMFSLIDALLDLPLEEALSQIALPADVKAALCGEPNPLRGILDLILAHERGDWNNVAIQASLNGIPLAMITALYVASVKSAQAVFC